MEGNRDMSSPIVKEGFRDVDGRSNDRGHSCFSMIPKLLMDDLEKSEHLWFALVRVLLDVWVGWLMPLMGLDDVGVTRQGLEGATF